MYCDTHTHINLISDTVSSWDQYVQNALAQKVNFMLNIGVDKKTMTESFHLAQKYHSVYWSAGYHPAELKESEEDIDIAFLEEQCLKPKLLGIGEIGLDYYYYQDNKKEQQKLFEAQIDVALAHNLPIIIHTRDAWEDTFAVLDNFKSDVRGIFHCFSGNYEIGKKCLDYDFMISFAGNVTFKKAEELQEAASKLPADRLFLETDAPYLTPVPKRGKTNEPSYVEYTYNFLSELRKQDKEELADIIKNNVRTFFKLEDL